MCPVYTKELEVSMYTKELEMSSVHKRT